MSEQVPTFLVAGDDHIVDVLFTTWDETSPGEWNLAEDTGRMDVSEDADRIVFETPVGCYEMPFRLSAGGTVRFETGPKDHPMYECKRPPHFKEEGGNAEVFAHQALSGHEDPR